jgi:hypothetical protein
MKLTIQCPDCGTKYTVDQKFEGRKLTCKKCELKFTIAAGPAAAPVVAARSSSSPATRPEPVPDNVYGLAEEPIRARARDAAAAGSSSNRDDDEPMPLPRPGSTKPLTETQKKSIAKRADKIEKSKPFRSNAAFGVSFGTVLAISLFGWRVQRALTKAERVAKRNQAIQTASAEVVDLKSYAVEIDEDVAEIIANNDVADAREWLDTAKYPNHEVAELTNQVAREVVDGFYERGGGKVYVISPRTFRDKVLTPGFAVQLPTDPDRRKQCFDWKEKYPNQEQITDYGQKYLLLAYD